MKALKQKENLLQIKKRRMRDRKQKNVKNSMGIVADPQQTFNPKKNLSPEEYKELMELLALIQPKNDKS